MNSIKRFFANYYSEIAVFAVTALALCLGWLLMNNVETRSVPFEIAGVKMMLPDGWQTSQLEEGSTVQARELGVPGFGTSYVVKVNPASPDVTPADVASLTSFDRARALTAYRVLDQAEASVNGRDAYKVTYAFVESNPDVTHAEPPVVVHAVDFYFVEDGKAVVATYQASEENYSADFWRFRRFLESLDF